MLKAAILGFGGLGHLHADTLWRLDGVKVEAVCDIDPAKLAAKEVEFNVSYEPNLFDISGSRTYLDYHEMLRSESLDLVVIALPTDLHAEATIACLDAGCSVFCEKPMGLSVEECDRMIEARNRSGKQLMIGQCLRFWPEYEFLTDCIRDGRYGKLKDLYMERVGGYPAADSWFNDGRRSGGAQLDLHVHDVDWVNYALGIPDAVYARGLVGNTGAIDDITAVWEYGPDTTITIRGSWMYAGGFSMTFQAFFEGATVDYNRALTPGFRVYKAENPKEPEVIEVSAETGHRREIPYFLSCVRGEQQNTVCPAESTRDSIALAILEREAISRRQRLEPGRL